MAETKLSHLSPRTPLERAEVARTGPGWEATRGKAEAFDRAIYEVMPPPVVMEIVQGERPPPPSEQELRAKLTEALTAEREAKAKVDRATAAHGRAKGLLQTRKVELAGFDDLQARFDQQTIASLREEHDRFDVTDDLRDQITLRERGRMAFAAADAAEQHLSDELADARDGLLVRIKAVNQALLPLLGITAEGFAQQIRECMAEIKRLEAKLLGYDRLCANYSGQLPERVRDLMFTTLQGRVGTPEQLSVWNDAAAVLKADPQAQVEIAEPPAPPPPPSGASYQLPHVAAVLAEQAKARAEQAEAEQAQEPPPEAA
jgi:hypothetical protein